MRTVVHDKTVEIGGIPIAYREGGKGKTIIFLHGAGGAPPRGASFVSMLAERHHVFLPSRPGFDDTPVGHCKTLQEVVEAIAGFIRQVAHEKVHIVAQSAGGAIGSWLTILHPELVESLVLSAPSAFAVRHASQGGPPSPEEIERRLYGDHPTWEAPPNSEERQRIANNARANMGRFTAPEDNTDLRARLAEITVPTLLICATDDRMIPVEAMRPFQQEIRTCSRIFIYGAAHEMPIAAATPWVRLISAFVDRGEYFLVNMG